MFTSVALLVLAGLLGPLLAAGKRPIAPVLVGELVAGAVLGRTGVHVIEPAAQPFPIFSSLGFAMLMLGAGVEVDVRSPDLHRGAVRGGLALVVALVASIPVGLALAAVLGLGRPELLVVLLAGSSAAVAFPTIQERGLTGPAVAVLIAWITLADAVTALLTGLATGFFVPAFFVLLGATLDLKGLVSSPAAILLAVAMAAGATGVHLAAAAVAGREHRVASGLLASAQLGLPAAAAALGLATGALSPPVAAAFVAGGCLTLVPATIGAMLLAPRPATTVHQEVTQ